MNVPKLRLEQSLEDAGERQPAEPNEVTYLANASEFDVAISTELIES